MGFKERLKEARLSKGLTQEYLAEQIGVAKSTLTGYEKGNREPDMAKITKIIEILDINADFLFQDDMQNLTELVISLNEQSLIKKYRALDSHGKEIVDIVLDKEYEHIQEQQLREPTQIKEIAQASLTYGKTEYLTGLSAGTGLFVFDDIPTQIINVPEEYKNADFVIGVSGNSMEPTFYDGDKVAVKKTNVINRGDIGVFMIGGNGYIKELGSGILISHNKMYNDIDIDETTVCIGKVLGKL